MGPSADVNTRRAMWDPEIMKMHNFQEKKNIQTLLHKLVP